MADIIIIGGAPAGASAAIYTARADKETLVFDKGGGTTRAVETIENYYGFPEGTTGPELVELGHEHAERFGAEFLEEEVIRVGQDGMRYSVETESGEYTAEGLIIATGGSYKTPGIGNIEDYENEGVSHCVECDAFFFQGQTVGVVGAENYAAKEALLLLDYTEDITLYTNGDEIDMDEHLVDQLERAEISIVTEPIDRVEGEGELERAVFEDGTETSLDGLFVAVGQAGGQDLAEMLGLPTDGNYIDVDEDMGTGMEKIYAAGDCIGGNRQVASSVGEGANAAINLLEELQGATYVDYSN
ncbi:NAD(P)/FAD-dependent oxidoreductase [Halodesulfurarchaeum sp.]|uniref:NAD(P)/FAD-dependent oxidoreductase n=1 Tax=Halodesulfurarchaeum sp. TaxID=1980530 RepID=UPI002FC3C81B